MHRIGTRVGVNPDTLRDWVKQADIDGGRRPGTSSTDAVRLRELEREVRELKRANEISEPPVSLGVVGLGLAGQGWRRLTCVCDS